MGASLLFLGPGHGSRLAVEQQRTELLVLLKDYEERIYTSVCGFSLFGKRQSCGLFTFEIPNMALFA